MTDPTDPTDPNATARYDTPPAPVPAAGQPDPVPPPPAAPPVAPPVAPTPPSWGAQPPMQPPAGAWRPRASDPGRSGSIVVGLIVLVVGLWFLADVTLDLDLPRLRWNELWPVVLILVGAWIALGSMRRGSR